MVFEAMSESARALLNSAQGREQGDYRAYSGFMRKLEAMPLSPGELESARRELIDILEI